MKRISTEQLTKNDQVIMGGKPGKKLMRNRAGVRVHEWINRERIVERINDAHGLIERLNKCRSETEYRWTEERMNVWPGKLLGEK